jgi:hypothetical protein
MPFVVEQRVSCGRALLSDVVVLLHAGRFVIMSILKGLHLNTDAIRRRAGSVLDRRCPKTYAGDYVDLMLETGCVTSHRKTNRGK